VPELPEVETVARGLDAAVRGKTIASVEVLLPRVAIAPPGEEFGAALAGERIEAVGRRGKYVVVRFVSGRRLIVHLRMTGRLIVQPPLYDETLPYTRVLTRFSDGSRLCFTDVRTFGRMRLLRKDEPWDADGGVEPLSQGFTSETFLSMLSGRRTAIKTFLLDQSRIAGIGNIYACEALWEAGIKPSRATHTISKPAGRRLHGAIRNVLQRAVAARGTSVDDYVDAEGRKGEFQHQLAVYGRLDEPCLRCGGSIVRTVIGQRGTWWCRRCQK
jgi:formamidopyrimidine-DNA glycosylase